MPCPYRDCFEVTRLLQMLGEILRFHAHLERLDNVRMEDRKEESDSACKVENGILSLGVSRSAS